MFHQQSLVLGSVIVVHTFRRDLGSWKVHSGKMYIFFFLRKRHLSRNFCFMKIWLGVLCLPPLPVHEYLGKSYERGDKERGFS